MIEDATKWNLGISKLSGFMKFIRPPFGEDAVAQFHGIIDLLEQASDSDLSHFRIPLEKMTPRILSARRASFSGRPGQVLYSDKKDCDAGFFRSQVDSLASYLPTIRGSKPVRKTNPYESLSNNQLQEIMFDRNIKPKRVVGSTGQEFVYDRAHAIAELLKDDLPKPPSSVSNVFNIRDSNFVHSSPGSSVTQTTGIKAEELVRIIAALRQFSESAETREENRAQINTDIGTLELQLNSARPNTSIIRTSLESAKAVLEHAAGHVLGEVALFGIKSYLGIP